MGIGIDTIRLEAADLQHIHERTEHGNRKSGLIYFFLKFECAWKAIAYSYMQEQGLIFHTYTVASDSSKIQFTHQE